MSEMRYFWFSYHAPARETRHAAMPSPYGFDLHHVRDGAAFAELAALLGDDYTYGGLLLNLPKRKAVEQLAFVNTDLLILPTRPPIHDRSQGDKRKILTSGTVTEKRIFERLKSVFRVCARSRIQLSNRLGPLLPASAADHFEIKFRQSTGAWYDRYRGCRERRWNEPQRQRTTAAYVVYLPSVVPDEPRLLAAFGLGGLETLIWAHLLRTRYAVRAREILNGQVARLVMGEFETPRGVPTPASLSFVANCHSKLIADVSVA